MGTIGANLQAVNERVARAADACGRRPQEVTLIAVSKSWGSEAVAEACVHGQRVFGESYVQEALAKIHDLQEMSSELALESDPMEACAALPRGTRDRFGNSSGRKEDPPAAPVQWHFIGPIQSNKTKPISENFAWVHSVDRLKIAERLSAARPAELAALQVCIQVNIGNESTKSGVDRSELMALARDVAALPRLKLRGLMAVPPATGDHTLQRRYFAELRHLKEELGAAGIALDTLSMGMSDDLEAAIAEGATLVRVGTAIFGERVRN